MFYLEKVKPIIKWRKLYQNFIIDIVFSNLTAEEVGVVDSRVWVTAPNGHLPLKTFFAYQGFLEKMSCHAIGFVVWLG